MSWADVEKTKTEKLNFTKFPESSTIIRVLDAEPYSFWQHWLPVQRSSVTCIGRDCPICEAIAKERANKLTPRFNNSQRHAIRVWNYTTNQMEVMIQGRKFMNQLLALHKEVGDLREYDVKIVRQGGGMDTTYMVLPSAPSIFDKKDEVVEVDFTDVFKPPTKDEMLQLMDGISWNEIREAS